MLLKIFEVMSERYKKVKVDWQIKNKQVFPILLLFIIIIQFIASLTFASFPPWASNLESSSFVRPIFLYNFVNCKMVKSEERAAHAL